MSPADPRAIRPRPDTEAPEPEAAINDRALLARVRDGDHAAFELVFRTYHTLLHAVASRLSHPDAAEEIVQDVLLALWARRASLDVQGHLRSYLLAAVRFTAASTVRRAQMMDRHAPAVAALHRDPAPADAPLLDDERVRTIEAAIARLPERCRMVFTLVRLEGLSYNDAAAALGISPKTVDAQMGNALRRLRQDLQEYQR